MRGNIGPITDLVLFAKEIREEAVKRILDACKQYGREVATESRTRGIGVDIQPVHPDEPCPLCARFVKAVRGE